MFTLGVLTIGAGVISVISYQSGKSSGKKFMRKHLNNKIPSDKLKSTLVAKNDLFTDELQSEILAKYN